MRILVAHSFYRLPGGEDRYVRQLVDLLAGHHDVHLEERVNAELGEGPGTALRMVHAPQVRSELRRSIRAFRPDVIHLHNPYPSLGPEVHLAAVESGTPLVQTAHNFRLRCPNGLLFTQGRPCTRCVAGRYDHAVRHECFPTRTQAAAYAQGLWLNRFIRRLDDKVDLYIAPSHFVRRRLIEWGIPAARTTVLRNFTVAPDSASSFGDRGLYLGRLSPEKGVSVLLEALRLADDPPFDIVGGGPAAAGLEAKGASLGLANVRFRGIASVADVPRVIEESRYAVAPSTWDENAPLAILEVMAAGRPVIASSVGGLPEIVDAGRGLLVPPGDPHALAEAIRGYVEDEGAAVRDGVRARAFVAAECSPDAHRAGLEAAYSQAIDLRHRRATNPGSRHPARPATSRRSEAATGTAPRERLLRGSHPPRAGRASVHTATGTQPLLTICTPTKDRPDLLRRALRSVTAQVGPHSAEVELVVSDNTIGDASETVARQLLAEWPGPTKYDRNRPPVGLVENHNRCLELATGRHVAFLHDDDFLLPGAVEEVLGVVSAPDGPGVHLFGVDVVNLQGRRRRRQRPPRDEVLPPEQALRRLLTASSYVRMPGLVATAEAYRSAGPFDPGVAGALDFDMWIRLFTRFGVHTVPRTVAAYTVHEAALTTATFTPSTIATLMEIFDRAAAVGVLGATDVRRCQATWFHQYILAGAYRRLERRDRTGAAEIMAMFQLPAIRRLGPSVRWLPARLAFSLLVVGAKPRSAAR